MGGVQRHELEAGLSLSETDLHNVHTYVREITGTYTCDMV